VAIQLLVNKLRLIRAFERDVSCGGKGWKRLTFVMLKRNACIVGNRILPIHLKRIARVRIMGDYLQ
jgi:hypothetical protein